MGRLIDLTGKRFERLIVLERDKSVNSNKGAYWLCKCDCGNIKSISSHSLRQGLTKSCGCLNKEIISQQKVISDMIGEKFGNLTVIERAETHITAGGQKKIMWLCKCDCGNITIAQGGNLRSGNTTNCGCEKTKSKGEILVSDFLTKNKINYLREYSFDNLRNKSGNLLRFDFAILNHINKVVMLVEYQGEQHYIECGTFGSYQREYSDKMKKDYCKSNNIPLFEIKYDDDLDSILKVLLNEIEKYNEI